MTAESFFKNFPNEFLNTSLEKLPPQVLADLFRQLAAAYGDMATVAGTLRDYITAATDRLNEGEYEKAAQTIRRASVLLAEDEVAPPPPRPLEGA